MNGEKKVLNETNDGESLSTGVDLKELDDVSNTVEIDVANGNRNGQHKHVVPETNDSISEGLKPVVICGPSGVGKGTLIARLMKEFSNQFGFSISHTTRQPRKGEHDAVDYHFIERKEMESQVKDGKFLEYADVHGNLYGTSIAAVEAVADTGKVITSRDLSSHAVCDGGARYVSPLGAKRMASMGLTAIRGVFWISMSKGLSW